MNICIVDDQVDIVKGIIRAVNWEELGVDNVFYAYNIQDAKEIINVHSIQIILCDIEMPMGNGIELLRWVKQRKEKIEFILLSAHAEFEFAQEAVKLGCFDYILQPAPYSEIQQVLARAVKHQKNTNEMLEIYDYGRYWKKQERDILDTVLKPYLLKNDQSCKTVIEKMHTMGYKLQQDTKVIPILIHMIGNRKPEGMWEDDLIRYAFDNILCEIFNLNTGQYLSTQLDLMNCAFLILSDNVSGVSVDQLQKFVQFCEEALHFSVTCYLGNEVEFQDLYEEMGTLYDMEQNNVIYKSAVHTKQRWKIMQSYHLVQPDMEKWEKMMEQGCYKEVRKEMLELLDTWNEEDIVNIKILENFYQSFIQMFFHIISYKKVKVHDFFVEDVIFEKYIHAHHSVEDMCKLVEYAMHFLEHIDANDAGQSYIEKACMYIGEHIEKDISRTKLAELLYISPEYLSRLFKKEMGMTLSDYVIYEKMKLAYSYLINTDILVSDIAIRVGYKNFSHFSQTFRKVYETSPMHIRKQYEKERKS
ncbi:MAG TPA: response regulator [Clostridiales bacterium]|nr:response regulator [Clostridiales bacterium]